MGLIVLLLVIGFVYLWWRINQLEETIKVSKGEKKKIVEEVFSPREEDIIPSSNVEAVPIPSEIKPESKKPVVLGEVIDKKIVEQDLEFKLGGKIFTGIGVIAVIFAISFLLRYAFENNLINETARVILGIITGITLLFIGEFTRRRFSTYGQIVTGGGLGVLYLSFYAAFNFYQIVTQPVSFIGMIFVTATGVFLAVKYNSIPLAGFAQLGGFITPFLLSSGSNNPHALFLYIALLDVGILAIAWWKLWRILTLGSFVGTVIVYSLWFANLYTPSQMVVAEGYATLFFFIFLAISLFQHFIQKSPQDEADLALTTINPALYFLISYIIINPLHHEWMGFFTAILAAFYLLLAFGAGNKSVAPSLFQQFLAGVGLVLLVIAVPIQFEKSWIAISWGIEALVLTFLGFQIASRSVRIFAQFVFVLTLLRLFLFDINLGGIINPWFNERFITFIVIFLFLSVATLVYWYRRSEAKEDEKEIHSFLLIASGLVFLAAMSLEIIKFHPQWWLSLIWSLGAIAIAFFALLLKSFPGRAFAFLVLAAAIWRLLLFDTRLGPDAQAWFNTRFLVFSVSILSAVAIYFIYRSFRAYVGKDEFLTASSVLLVLAYFLSLWLINVEIDNFHPKFWLPICWSFGFLIGGFISLYLRNIYLRGGVYITIILIFFHLLLFEGKINFQTDIPFLNARVLSFLVAILSMIIFLTIIKKEEKALPKKEKEIVQPFMFLGINFLLIWLLSAEVLDYFNEQIYQLSAEERIAQRAHFQNLKNASLSVSWTLYTIILLILGIIKRSTSARFLAIFLFGIIILKVFLYDTANLNNFYKFISFITLGCILLFSGYLYYRYRDRISRFIQAA